MSIKLLVIEDDISIGYLLKYDFERLDYEVTIAKDGLEAIEVTRDNQFDVMIIDWMLPNYNGIDLVRKFRSEGSVALMIMVTAKGEESDILEAFDAGVDDYVTKPFSPRELSARIGAHLKRVNVHRKDKNLEVEDIKIDLDKRRVYVKDDQISLTKKEFELLHLFLVNYDVVLSRDTILNKIWKFDYDGDTRIVDVHVFKLRVKIEDSNIQLQSERGVGYVAQRK